VNPALLQRLNAQPALKTLPTPTKPKPVKREKKERISQADLSYLKSRAVLHVREMIAEFFPHGRLTPGGYWVTDDLRISRSSGCLWKNKAEGYSRRHVGDVLTLFLIAKGFLVPVKPVAIEGLSEGRTRVEELKLKIAATYGSRITGYYGFPEPESFAKGVEAFSTWLEQFPARSEIHELLAYDS
jgi:hypothetical protein